MPSMIKLLVFGTIGATLLIVWIIPYLVANDISLECYGEKGDCFTGKVTRIIDGDTIRVNDIPIRLALVSTPELDENGGKDAKEFVEKTCQVGSMVTVDEDDEQLQGSYDRMIAEIHCNGKSLNSEILESQLGKIDTKFCTNSEFASEQWAIKYGCSKIR